MKRFLFSCVFVFCAIPSWGLSVVVMRMAVTMSNTFAHAKTMLINDGLSVDKTSKLNSANCVVLTNSGKYQDNVLIVRLYKAAKSQKVEKCEFVFSPNGKFYRSLGADLRKYGYVYEGSAEPDYQELHSCDNLGCGLNINKQGWLEATFLRYDN